MIEGRGAELRTARLLLRSWRDEDQLPFAAINADPEVTRYLGGGGRPLSNLETAAFLDRSRRHWEHWGYGLWAMELLEGGRFAGFVGPSHHRWYPAEVELGWRLDRTLWFRGIATEGGAAALEHAFTRLGLERLISIIHRDNLASRRVAEKIGFRPHEEESREGLPVVVYRAERPVWEAARGQAAPPG